MFCMLSGVKHLCTKTELYSFLTAGFDEIHPKHKTLSTIRRVGGGWGFIQIQLYFYSSFLFIFRVKTHVFYAFSRIFNKSVFLNFSIDAYFQPMRIHVSQPLKETFSDRYLDTQITQQKDTQIDKQIDRQMHK